MSVRALLVLSRHSLRRIRAMLLGIGLLLAAFQFFLTQVGVYLVRHSAFSELSLLMPEFVRNIAGPGALAFMSFTGIVSLGYFHPMVIAAVIGLTIAIASEPAAEMENRFVDLTLARDLTRSAVILRTVLVFAVMTVFVLALMTIGTATGLGCCTPPDIARPDASTIASLAVSLGSVMACWAGVTIALAAAGKRRAVAGGAAGVAALAAFLLDYLGRAWEPAHTVAVVSPFHYFDPTLLMMGQPLKLTNLAVLFGMGVAGTIVGLVVFTRRDI